MKVLVTGASGFIGRHLVKYLRDRGFTVIDLDLRSSTIIGDVTDWSFVSSLEHLDFNSIVHLAAMVEIKDSLSDMYGCYRVNSFGTLNLLELAFKKKVERFVYASSANVYGLPLELPVKETTPFNPRTPYDYSKVISEYLVQSYYTNRELPIVILRSWKLFGEYENENKVIPRFIKSCLLNQPITLYNGGRDTTDPYYILNYCYAVELALTKDEAVGEAFNVGTGNELSIKDIAENIKKLTNSKSELQFLPPRTPREEIPMRSYPSIEKIKSRLGYRPIVDFVEGLERTIRWMSERLNLK
ncbi:MAG: GDP-mannose 4,6-dehydratase [Nitrososphaerota archaeon]|nr:GDP-mannose 4,6-dehydratase [Nitrososphaerales archaeon]MDW8044333.1 GDP-mannose 4,6-dehydratase [Nitrososphaerota archaeon]